MRRKLVQNGEEQTQAAMTRANRKRAAWITALLLGSVMPGASADQSLRFGPRADRHEGIRAKKVAGFGVGLLSALVEHRDNSQRTKDRWHIRFYLKQRTNDVHIVVRELNYKEYYWMDEVQPQSPWKAGFDNVFSWQADEVVGPLDLRIWSKSY